MVYSNWGLVISNSNPVIKIWMRSRHHVTQPSKGTDDVSNIVRLQTYFLTFILTPKGAGLNLKPNISDLIL